MKKLLSIIIAVVLTFSLSCEALAGYFAPPESGTSAEYIDPNLQISGTNSFGNMLSAAIDDQLAEQQENAGYNVISVDIIGQTATVELSTLCDSTVVVGIYDEAGEQLLMTASAPVTQEDEYVTVSFERSLPQYFFIKAYLIDSTTLRPLCTVYDCPNYTQEMQEFFAKTVYDFNPEKVLNLDSDVTNNFAVYSDNVTVIPQVEGMNTLLSQGGGVYIFANADENILALQPGQIFSYEYAPGEVIIAKVAAVTENPDGTVTVTEQDAELEDAFEYIKIDTEAGMEKATVDNSTLSDGVTYLGDKYIGGEPEQEISPMSLEGGKSKVLAKEYNCEFEDSTDTTKIYGSARLSLSLEASVKYYISWSQQYIEVRLKTTAEIEANFEFTFKQTKNLSKFVFSIVPGITLTVTPSIVFEASVTGHILGTYEAMFGARAESGEGVTVLKSSRGKINGDVEGRVYMGIMLTPSISIICENIASVSLSGTVGVEVKGKLSVNLSTEKPTEAKVHACHACLEGEVNILLNGYFKASLLNCDNLTYTKTFPKEDYYRINICRFYASADYNDFGFGRCPHYKYKTSVSVLKSAFKFLPDVSVSLSNGMSFTTDSVGKTPDFYLDPGNYTVTCTKAGYYPYTGTITVTDKKITGTFIQMRLKPEENPNPGQGTEPGTDPDTEPGTNPGTDPGTDPGTNPGTDPGTDPGTNPGTDPGTNPNPNPGIQFPVVELVPGSKKVRQVNLGGRHSAAITADGCLYMWGDNFWGQLGNVAADVYNPNKIMDNVYSVSLGGFSHSAIITTDGRLYMCGNNVNGMLGTGTVWDSSVPVQIMDNVASVSLGWFHSAAITTDGSLYMWGDNEYGQLGNGTTEYHYTPRKIMDNVAFASLGANYSAAINTDGSLYMWGSNDNGKLGEGWCGYGSKNYSKVPIKIMDNVASVSLGDYHSAAITTDGSLYMWGYNGYGQLGNGTTEDSYVPIKIMDNIVSVSLGTKHSAAITSDGSLYMWGSNGSGQLGKDKTITQSPVPIKIMDNVASVSLGGYASAAITTDGSLYVWGSNQYAQIGNGHSGDKIYAPTKVTLSSDNAYISTLSALPMVAAETSPTSDVFTGLIPNEVYNIYALRSRTAAEPLAASNLLYIAQATSDAAGNLPYNCTPLEDCPNPVIFCKAMHEFALGNAQISGADISRDSITVKWDAYPGADMYRVYRVMNGVYILEGETPSTEYTVSGLSAGREYGFAVECRVNGEWSYRAAEDVVYIQTEAEPEYTPGDVNADGNVTLDDAILTLKKAMNVSLGDEQFIEAAADVVQDGKISLEDAIEILKIAMHVSG